jgi:hypothetical protein
MAQKNKPAPSTPPRELAKKLLHVLKTERIAATFIENYAKQFERPEASAHPQRRRELEVMLDREILLAMTSHLARTVETNAPRAPRRARLASIQDPAKFLRELVAALAKESGWTAGDAMEFRGDLEIYRRLTALATSRSTSSRSRIVPAGPFVDRCAILLDPSMIENASRAAGKLLLQLESHTENLFNEAVQSSAKTKPR